jgi:NAD(P)H-dependent flavin oxidoreductase YrpB (nitropropane dioxygenase family)
MPELETALTRAAGVEVPIICGAMYPCSNPELVAAVSEAGGLGIVQPISLSYVHGHEFRAGLRFFVSSLGNPRWLCDVVPAAGGVGREEAFVEALRLGYAGVQMGTRFIATPECRAPDAYKDALVGAGGAGRRPTTGRPGRAWPGSVPWSLPERSSGASPRPPCGQGWRRPHRRGSCGRPNPGTGQSPI